MSSRTRMPSTAAALLGLVALLSTPAFAADVVLRFGSINTENTAPYEQVLLPFAKAVEEESGGRIEVALKPLGGYGKPAELFTMVEKGDHRNGGDRAGVPPRPLPAVVGDGTALHVRELDRGHLGDDVALQGGPARQGLRVGEGAWPLRAAALSDLHDRQEDPVGEGFPRPAHAHAEHHRRRGAGQARRGAARHSAQHDRRHHRQRLCRRHRLWLGFRHHDQGRRRQVLSPISSTSWSMRGWPRRR